MDPARDHILHRGKVSLTLSAPTEAREVRRSANAKRSARDSALADRRENAKHLRAEIRAIHAFDLLLAVAERYVRDFVGEDAREFTLIAGSADQAGTDI